MMSDFVENFVWDLTQVTSKRIYIIWLLLDLSFLESQVYLLWSPQSLTFLIDFKISLFSLFLSSMTVNENIFDILFYWKNVI